MLFTTFVKINFFFFQLVKVFVALVPITVVSMSYEWQGERLYMIGYDSSAHYEIWRVPIVHTAGIERVYQLSGGVEQVSNLVVDSFRQG